MTKVEKPPKKTQKQMLKEIRNAGHLKHRRKYSLKIKRVVIIGRNAAEARIIEALEGTKLKVTTKDVTPKQLVKLADVILHATPGDEDVLGKPGTQKPWLHLSSSEEFNLRVMMKWLPGSLAHSDLVRGAELKCLERGYLTVAILCSKNARGVEEKARQLILRYNKRIAKRDAK